jgi:hypothetical protein
LKKNSKDREKLKIDKSIASKTKSEDKLHEYKLSEYGLSEDIVRDKFRNYIEAFDL